MQGKEIISLLEKKLREYDVSVYQFLEYDFDDDIGERLLQDFGNVEVVSQKRSNAVYVYVVHFKDHNVYLEFDGDYSSWSGANFDDCTPFEVTKATKVVEYWKRVSP